MRVCRFAKSKGVPCSDGTSKMVECEHDGEVRCLKHCIRSCNLYRPKEEEPVVRPPQRVVPQQSVAVTSVRYNSVGANTAGTTYKGGCGGCGKNISYG